jgi:hypothetical protein
MGRAHQPDHGITARLHLLPVKEMTNEMSQKKKRK